MTKAQKLPVTTIGAAARQTLSQAKAGVILGVTRRGFFLHFSPGKVIFISLETCRGPLTLNAAHDLPARQSLVVGEPAQVHAGNIIFENARLTIDTRDANTWEAPVAGALLLPKRERFSRLMAISQSILAHPRGSMEKSLLQTTLEVLQNPGMPLEGSPFFSELKALAQALEVERVVEISSPLVQFLGKGTGLTPAGDDLLIGFLLTLHRWGRQLYPGRETQIQEISSQVVRSAYQATTTLSANLIECAAMGQADERLVGALDGIITGEPGIETCAAFLQNWGASSGENALAGMALALPGWSPRDH